MQLVAQGQCLQGLRCGDVGDVTVVPSIERLHPPAAGDALFALQPGETTLDAFIVRGDIILAHHHNGQGGHAGIALGFCCIWQAIDESRHFLADLIMPLVKGRHVTQRPAAIGVLFGGQQRQCGIALGLRHDFGHVIRELKAQDAVEVIFWRRIAQPCFHFLDASKQLGVLEVAEPSRCGGDRTDGLHGEFEVRGDVGDLDFAVADEGAVGGLAVGGLTREQFLQRALCVR